MTKAEKLIDLAKRCEAATGPSYQLECDISTAVHRHHHIGMAYTQSLDAAVTLIPSGLYWSVSFGRLTEDEPLGGADIYTVHGDMIVEAEAATPVLALCAAALRARAEEGGE